MRWAAPEAGSLLEAATQRFGEAVWPEAPEGFALLGAPRDMRRVLGGALDGREVVVKWSRPVTTTDRLARALRGGKGPREGRLLRALGKRGVRVPEPLAYTDEGPDLLVTARLDGAAPLPSPADATHAQIECVARLLGRAFAAGLRHRDLHAGNLVLVDGRPVLLDLGGARIVLHVGGEVRELGRLQHGLAAPLPRAGRLRALKAWLREAEVPTIRLRDLIRMVDREAREITRRYRRGRDRRATRTGRHYVVFEEADGTTGVRRRDTPSFWPTAVPEWLAMEPPEVTWLKSDGRVVRTHLPGRDAGVVVKRYEASAPGRVPRAVRAFRKAVWLEHRDLDAPRPLLALAGADGPSLLVSGYVEGAVDLNTLLLDAGAGLGRHERATLAERLGRFLRRMHDAEISHRDLKAPNLLVTDEPPRIVIADVDGVARRVVGWRRRAKDLARLDASVDAPDTDRARVLRAYWRSGPRPAMARHDFARWIARHVARKRGPAGLPR